LTPAKTMAIGSRRPFTTPPHSEKSTRPTDIDLNSRFVVFTKSKLAVIETHQIL